MKRAFFLFLGIFFLFLSNPMQSEANSLRSLVIKGDAVTGTNRLKGHALRDFGTPIGRSGFYNLSTFNPEGDFSLEITTDTPGSALLATGADPDFLALLNLSIGDLDASLLNIPLRDVPVNVDPAGVFRIPMPDSLDVNSLVPSQSHPSDPITLDQWLKAKGIARIQCDQDEASVTLSLKDLIPNRLYTVWAILGGEGLIPRPLGGVPNVLMSDHRGDAHFSRKLIVCPLDSNDFEPPMLLIDVVFHSDQQVYGDVPDLPFAGLVTGIVTHTQLEFAISGTRIP